MPTEWKPGPPPLDKAGHYEIVLLRSGVRDRYFVIIEPGGHVGIAIAGGPNERRAIVESAEWHYPIPDPPETET